MVRVILFLTLSLPVLAQVDFATSIHPILETRCAPCHSGPKPAAGFSVETRASILRAIKPFSSAASVLLRRIMAGEMPPTGAKLTDSQIASFDHWIAEGANWTDTLPQAPSEWIPPIKPRTVALPANPAPNPNQKFHPRLRRCIGRRPLHPRSKIGYLGHVPVPNATKKF